jgi:hypothetical protein
MARSAGRRHTCGSRPRIGDSGAGASWPRLHGNRTCGPWPAGPAYSCTARGCSSARGAVTGSPRWSRPHFCQKRIAAVSDSPSSTMIECSSKATQRGVPLSSKSRAIRGAFRGAPRRTGGHLTAGARPGVRPGESPRVRSPAFRRASSARSVALWPAVPRASRINSRRRPANQKSANPLIPHPSPRPPLPNRHHPPGSRHILRRSRSRVSPRPLAFRRRFCGYAPLPGASVGPTHRGDP